MRKTGILKVKVKENESLCKGDFIKNEKIKRCEAKKEV
jgi:hypothetical protein